MAVLLLPSVFCLSALRPFAVLSLPVVLKSSAAEPMAMLLLPVVLLMSASKPIAVLASPVLFKSASSPRTVFSFVKQPSWQTARACGASVSHVRASTSGMRSPAILPQWRDDRFIEFVGGEVFVFIKTTFLFPRLVNCATAGLNEGKKLSGEAPSPGFRP